MNTVKRPKVHYHYHQHSESETEEAEDELIPGLPGHIAHLCLSKLPPSLLFTVSSSWRRLIYSPLFPPFLSLYSLLSPLSPLPNSLVHFSSFDPISSRWLSLPRPPLPLLSRHPSFISRYLPIQAVTVSGRLILLAATSLHLLPALPHPLLFDPLSSSWCFCPHLPVPRRWCAAAALGSSVYVASGVGSHFCSHTARSLLRWDLNRSGWDLGRPLPNGRFSREAVDAVGWRGRLCVVHVAAKEGLVYDPRKDDWSDMAEGMVAGWRGPVAAMDEEEIYVVDDCKGVLRRYEEERDCWVDVWEDERLRGAQQMATGAGKFCVVSGSGRILVVDVTVSPVRTWVVEPPSGFEPVAVHVLPRMSMPEHQLPPVLSSVL